MAWNNRLTQLNDALAELVPFSPGIERVIRNANMKVQKVSFNGNAMDIWNSVLSEADKLNKVDDLVREVLKQFPDDPYLKSALSGEDINYSLSPDFDNVAKWQPVSEQTLEVLTYGSNTLLPIHFLERGVAKSRPVAKVEIRRGSQVDVGTGFLFRLSDIDELFFMTNYHVINDPALIPNTRIIFDYELDVDENSKKSKSFEIDENGPWYSSPIDKNDVTIFRLKDSNSDLCSFGYLCLKEIEINANEFVNIIQHPGGQMKQISLYHNIVTNCDDRIVQYLTDTLKGSSGAPVFNSNWDVVAIHHSGGSKKNGEPALPVSVKSRNEGIHINAIIQFVKSNYPKY